MKILDNIAKRLGYEKARHKQPPKQNGKRDFQAASISRLFADWVRGPGVSRNEKIRRGLVTMRTRSRDLCENDDYAKKFISLCKTNVVGPQGIRLQMDVIDPNGSSDNWANDIIEAAWDEQCKKENCTVIGQDSFLDVQNLVMETIPTDGEILIRKVRGFDNPTRYAIQVLPNDCLDEEYNAILPSGNEVRMGVERDKWKRPVAYHIRVKDPTDLYYSGAYSTQRERIPANEIIHRFLKTSPDQVRGFPWFHTSMTRMQMLGGYEEAALVASRIGACKMGFFTYTPNADGAPSYQGDATDETGNQITEVEPGSFEDLPYGRDFKSFDPSYPHTEYSQYIKAVLRGIASGLGVSYNSLANDLEGVNYSSIRAGLLEERDVWMSLQAWLINHVVNDIFVDWLEFSLDMGLINLPAAKFKKFNRPKWFPRRWAWVDPEKDINASIKAIDYGLSTRTKELAQSGDDLEETLRTLEKEKALEKSFGLEFPSDLNAQKAAIIKSEQKPTKPAE